MKNDDDLDLGLDFDADPDSDAGAEDGMDDEILLEDESTSVSFTIAGNDYDETEDEGASKPSAPPSRPKAPKPPKPAPKNGSCAASMPAPGIAVRSQMTSW